MKAAARKWLQRKADRYLERIGIEEGQTVLDFGSNEGHYTIVAAGIVGERGKVYALDKERKPLGKLMQDARRKGLQNVQRLYVKEDQQIPLRPRSVDVVLLYDTLHRCYFPEVTQRKRVLRRIYRVLKAGGRLSYFPTHLKAYGVTFRKLLKEVDDVGFCLEHEHRRILIHDGKLVRGRVFSFRRPLDGGLAKP